MSEPHENLSIFHYHFLPGGVTKVVTIGAAALLEHGSGIQRITLVAGNDDNLENVRNEILASSGAEGSRVKTVVVPEIGYVSMTGGEDGLPSPSPDLCTSIKAALTATCGGDIWWIHNHHLGKNPLFTRALTEIASETPDQLMVFQIHDFPESSRYGNLTFLNSFIHGAAYPTTPNVQYAVINGRDEQLLINAGIPETSVSLLSNPVGESIPPRPPRSFRMKLEENLAGEFPGYVTGAPTALYPIRSIRRKNVIEAALLSRISPDPFNILVTLPGVSVQEAEYSRLTESLFTDGTAAGMFSVGTRIDAMGMGFEELVADSDLILSSSVQEGFGYLFLNAMTWGKPLIARYLDILDGIGTDLEGASRRFYHEIQVPVSETTRARISRAYHGKLEHIEHLMNPEDVALIAATIDRTFGCETVDFSLLSADDQAELLRSVVQDGALKTDIRDLNTSLMADLRDILSAISAGTAVHPEDPGPAFSLAGYAKKTEEIISNLQKKRENGRYPAAESDDSIQKNLIASFAELPFLRLLFDYRSA